MGSCLLQEGTRVRGVYWTFQSLYVVQLGGVTAEEGNSVQLYVPNCLNSAVWLRYHSLSAFYA